MAKEEFRDYVAACAASHGIHDEQIVDEVSLTLSILLESGKYSDSRQMDRDCVLLLYLVRKFAADDHRGAWVVGSSLRMLCMGFAPVMTSELLNWEVAAVQELLGQLHRWLFSD